MKIYLDNGDYIKFKPKPLYLGRKKINKQISKENLEILSNFLISIDIKFILGYGTLLGAIRDHDFITHDEDVDICLEKNILNVFLTEFKKNTRTGFRIVRYDDRGFISLMRKNEYIDMYFFSEKERGILECCGIFMLANFMTETTEITFLNHKYFIPKNYEQFFKIEYGNKWNVPVEYKHSKFQVIRQIFKYYLKFVLPRPIQRVYLSNKSKKNYRIYKEKIAFFEKDENHIQ